MLESIGVLPEDEAVYPELLSRAHAGVAAIALALGHDEVAVEMSLGRLEGLGMVSRLGRVPHPDAGGAAGRRDRLEEPIAEFYIAEELWPDLSRSLALREGVEPNLRVRVPNEVWPLAEVGCSRQGRVGDAVLAADLLEAAEPRAVAAGASRLGELLASWQRERSRG